MKKQSRLLLIALLAASMVISAIALGGCGKKDKEDTAGGQAGTFDVDSLKTFGDIIDLEKEDTQCAVYDDKVVYAFGVDGKYYRAMSGISKEDAKKYRDVDFSEEDYEEKQNEILRPIEIEKIEDLSDQILSQDELDKLAGKTGKELQEDGWTGGGSFNLETMEVWMDKGPFTYTVIFDGDLSGEDVDTIDIVEATKDMKVKSAEFSALGDATNIE